MLHFERVTLIFNTMKKTFIFLILLLFTIKLLSQNIPNSEYSKNYYLQKSKNQKTAGWILLSAGVVITTVGIIGFDNTYNDNWHGNSSSDTYGFLVLAGPLISLGSIPLFISSGSNAQKVATLSISNQPILFPRQDSCVLNLHPSLSLKVNF
jgi:hypothetical protein